MEEVKGEVQIVQIKPELREIFIGLCSAFEMEKQYLDSQSEKPFIIHRKTNQVSYVVKGKGKFVGDNRLYEIQSGDLIIMSANTKHSFKSDDGIELYHAHWPKENIEIDREILENICKIFI